MEMETFFFQLPDFVIQLSEREAVADSNYAEYYVATIESYLNILDDIKTVLSFQH